FLSKAKRLSLRRALWAFFPSSFNYIISFLPGTKNIRTDSLSQQFSSSSKMESASTPVIPLDYILATLNTILTSSLGERILASQIHSPPGKPHDCCFVPENLCTALL
ncbi:unnamed protein product, partial [Staurois parvus]